MENRIENPYVGMKCRKGNEVILEKTPAGYCLGTWDKEGPCCRISDFAPTEEGAKCLVPSRICEENIFCNGGLGCELTKLATASGDTTECSEDAEELIYYVVKEVSARAVAVPKKVIESYENFVDFLEQKWHERVIELDSEDFEGVYFDKITPGSEYSYLLERFPLLEGIGRSSIQVIRE